jgi:hypothetical protein
VLGISDSYGDNVFGAINSLPNSSHLSEARQLAICQKIEKLQEQLMFNINL